MVSDKRREDFEKIALYAQAAGMGLLTLSSVLPQDITDKANKKMLGTTYPHVVDHIFAVQTTGFGTALVCASRAEKKTRRELLRASSAGWLIGAGIHLYHGFVSKQENKEAAVGFAVPCAALGAAGLAAGFQKYGDDKKTDTKKSTK